MDYELLPINIVILQYKERRRLTMRYIIEEISSPKNAENVGRSALVIEEDGGRMLLSAPAIVPDIPRVVVQAFDPDRDIFYRSREKLTPEELSEEIEIHIPEPLSARMKDRIASSSIAGLALMQYVPADCHAISPLSALEGMLRATGSVNSAILQADNGGLLFVRSAGEDITAHASDYSLKTFLDLSYDGRENVFPDFHASEIIFSGSDIGVFDNFDLGDTLETARRISISDFTSICDFTDDAAILVQMNPHLYTLAIGAASVFVAIMSEA